MPAWIRRAASRPGAAKSKQQAEEESRFATRADAVRQVARWRDGKHGRTLPAGPQWRKQNVQGLRSVAPGLRIPRDLRARFSPLCKPETVPPPECGRNGRPEAAIATKERGPAPVQAFALQRRGRVPAQRMLGTLSVFFQPACRVTGVPSGTPSGRVPLTSRAGPVRGVCASDRLSSWSCPPVCSWRSRASWRAASRPPARSDAPGSDAAWP